MANGSSDRTRSSQNNRFLITGAKGFIGAWVVKALVERGDKTWILDLDSQAYRLEALLSQDQLAAIEFIQGDVTAFQEVESAVVDHGITHIIHLAALQVPACAANPPQGARVNVLGTLNIFDVARRHRDLLRGIAYASSAAVFGPEELYGQTTVPGDAPLLPGTHYGVFKQCNEGNARVYFLIDGISSVGLRPWAVYGVGRDQGVTSGPTKAIKAAVLGRPYTIRFTGGLDLQYGKDTAEIFLRCAEMNFSGARVYTLRGAVVKMDEFLAALERVLPRARGLIRAEGPQLPIAYDLDDSQLVKDLGNVPRTPLEQGIRETAEIFDLLARTGKLDAGDLAS